MIEILKNVCVKYCLANQKNIPHLVIQLVEQMAGKSNEILGNKDVPKYAGDYFFSSLVREGFDEIFRLRRLPRNGRKAL